MAVIESALVVGGCGFLGHHIVGRLLSQQSSIKITVMGRSNDRNRRDGVEYVPGDLTCADAVDKIVDKVKPQVIFNTVAPTTFPRNGTPESHYKVNVTGTSNLIGAARKSPQTEVFIYTSSAHTPLSTDYLNAHESDPINLDPTDIRFPTTTKAVADDITLAANNNLNFDSGGLRTATIRPCAIFGENDSQLLPTIISQFESGVAKFQIGNNTAMYDFVYVGNVADAHVSLAGKLLQEIAHTQSGTGVEEKGEGQVAGKAFFITNDQPMTFYNFMRHVWRENGYEVDSINPVVIPKSVALGMGSIKDWAEKILPASFLQDLSRESIEHLCCNRTHDISRAKQLLGYQPRISIEEGIRRGVKSLQSAS